MLGKRSLPMTGLIVALMVLLATLGVGYGLWSKVLVVEGTVNTGDVNAEFVRAFTDDDNKVDEPDIDRQDTGDCPISVNGDTSCDPAASGRDPKPHYDKDVGQCFADLKDTDPDQIGSQGGTVTILNGYPSYYCTAWFRIHNNGSIPVKVASVKVNGVVVIPSQVNRFDLSGDGRPDLALHVSDIEVCQQIEPSERVWMNLDQHVEQPAPQGEVLRYRVEVQLNQWNEAAGCDQIIDADGTATRFSGDPGAREVKFGDPLTTWPTGRFDEGLDWFDHDGNKDWTFGPAGDDLHVEDPTRHPGAIRDGNHDDSDPLVLDIDNSLAGGIQEPVSCDMETGTFCAAGMLPGKVKFHDLNGNGFWDNGEDIVYDANNDGIFN